MKLNPDLETCLTFQVNQWLDAYETHDWTFHIEGKCLNQRSNRTFDQWNAQIDKGDPTDVLGDAVHGDLVWDGGAYRIRKIGSCCLEIGQHKLTCLEPQGKHKKKRKSSNRLLFYFGY